jgi:transcriptional regulator with XRE-family HTH domain
VIHSDIAILDGVTGSDLVREARRRAGLSQADLAARVGTTQSAIARLERGRSSPSFRRVVELVEACGLELRARIAAPAPSGQSGPPWVPDEVGSILAALEAAGVRAIVIGDVAEALHGVAVGDPATLTIVPEPAVRNLEALARALDGLHARLRTDVGSLPFERDAATLASADRWRLVTTLGPLDLDRGPLGTEGYRDLARDAEPLDVAGSRVSVASLADVVRIAAAAEPVDDDRLAVLRRTLADRSG